MRLVLLKVAMIASGIKTKETNYSFSVIFYRNLRGAVITENTVSELKYSWNETY